MQSTLDQLTASAYVYHQCGRGNRSDREHPRYKEVEFITSLLPALLERADLVVCRAGANTIAELALFGVPALLIPLSGSYSRGDQEDNARHLEQHGSARVLSEDVESETFAAVVCALLEDDQARRALADSMAGLGKPASASLIADLVREQGGSIHAVGVTIASICFNSVDIIVFSLAIIAGIVGTLTGFRHSILPSKRVHHRLLVALMFTKIVAEILTQRSTWDRSLRVWSPGSSSSWSAIS